MKCEYCTWPTDSTDPVCWYCKMRLKASEKGADIPSPVSCSDLQRLKEKARDHPE